MISRISGIHTGLEQTEWRDVQMVYQKTFTTYHNYMVQYGINFGGSLHYHNHIVI